MLKHILIPLDGSELAYTAINHLKEIANAGAQVTLLMVLDKPDVLAYDFYPMPNLPRVDYEKIFEESKVRAKTYLADVVSQISMADRMAVSYHIEVGDPATCIVDFAKQHEVDAILMCTHGRSGLSRWLFGSVTEKVLVSGVCPIYVIPARKQALNTQELQAVRQAAAPT